MKKNTRLAVLLPAAALAALLFTGCDDGSSDPSSTMNQQGAAVACQQFVEKQLDQPKMDFSGVTATHISVVSTKKPWTYTVRAFVDTQNLLGGPLRERYHCTVSTRDADTWTLQDLTFDD
ncbi:hypothetical protein ACH4S8_37885 [Streptomyces sp. NPDC021080]|uniref:hypothetical protein n=1 Tax=Streptomyces sp. NPDC021080 TaxID=3365110 RepID=UPI0037A55831